MELEMKILVGQEPWTIQITESPKVGFQVQEGKLVETESPHGVEIDLSEKRIVVHGVDAERLLRLTAQSLSFVTRFPKLQPSETTPGKTLPDSPLTEEGEWLMPPMSLRDIGVRLGNLSDDKVKTLLRSFGLRLFQNRQSWTFRFDMMPRSLRDHIESRLRPKLNSAEAG